MWNHFQNSGPRTNNHLKSWHYRLNRLARKAHPNMFETIEHIKNEQASTEVQMIQIAAGGQPRPKKRKAVRQDEQIKRLVAKFSSEQRTLDSILSALVNMVVDFS